MFDRDLITLDFDGDTIRLLLVQNGTATHWESLSLGADVMNQGVVRDPAAAGAGLAQMLARQEARRPKVVTSVTGQRAISRLLTFPPVKDRLLAEAVRHKARQEFPLPVEETDLTWHIVGRSAEGLEVYVLAVPREAIDGQVAALRAAGLKPAAMDLKPLALARLVDAPMGLLLNLEEHGLNILLVENGIPSVVRAVPFTTLRPGPEARLDLLLQELARTVKFYNEGHRDDPLPPDAPVFATGNLLEAQGMRLAVERSHGAPVRLPASPVGHPHDLPVATFAVNLGLAGKKV